MEALDLDFEDMVASEDEGSEIISEDIAVIEPNTFEIKLSHPYIKLSLAAKEYFNINRKNSIKLNSDKREGHLFERLLKKNKHITDIFFLTSTSGMNS